MAALAGVGATWYTWLEQGRDVRASVDVLEALAGALQLDDVERSHLVLLGRGERVPAPAPVEHVPAPVRRLIDNLHDSPACIIGRRSDFLAWNRALSVLMGDPGDLPEGRRNQIWAIFKDPGRRTLMGDWAEGARAAVARFRADSARHVGDPAFADLIAELRADCPEFRRWWQRHEVLHHGTGRKRLNHPEQGEMAFEHAVFRLEVEPDQRMILYTPLPDHDTPRKMEELVTGRSARTG